MSNAIFSMAPCTKPAKTFKRRCDQIRAYWRYGKV